MRLFTPEATLKMFDTLGLPDDEPIEHSVLSKAIERAQKKVEGNNFGVRKHLLEYDQVMNEQREVIYDERYKSLRNEDLKENILSMVKDVISNTVASYTAGIEYAEEWDLEGVMETLYPIIPLENLTFPKDNRDDMTVDSVIETLYEAAKKLYDDRESELGGQVREIERVILLKIIDQKWMDHIDNMEQMRQGIGLTAYGQRDPLVEYKFAGFEMFEEMSYAIKEDVTRAMYHVRIAQDQEIKREHVVEPTATNQQDDSLGKQPVQRAEEKVGRNQPCPCGSGKKYKHCCGSN